jgi:DNA-binding NarL/FixJ family response regulator
MGKKTLLMEDSMLDAELTTYALTQCKIDNQVVHATDGGVALWHLAVETSIAVVLLDLKLRIVNGLEILAMTRAHPDHANLPVIILSRSIDPHDHDRAALLGISGFVSKNSHIHAFSIALREVLAPFQAKLAA